MNNILTGALLSLFLVSCTAKKSFDPKEANRDKVESDANQNFEGDDSLLSEDELANLSKEEIICQQGPRVTQLVKKADFASVFALICEGGGPNDVFNQLIEGSYKGSGEPKVSVISSTTDENLVTEIVLGYVINVPMDNPSQFSSYKAHNIFADGVDTGSSKMVINVAGREEFPGRRSVEAIQLNYNISMARGASIYDVRSTEFNTYLLREDYRDVVLSTEHITDAATNNNYHLSPGLNIGIANGDGNTDLMFLSKLVIKERIDPSRIEAALTELNAKVAEMIHSHIVNSQQ